MYTFSKQERLCSKKSIDALFQSGQRMMAFPYSVHWKLCPAEELPDGISAQVLIATSKKKFKHAVDRNRVKRLTRECYRKQKEGLYTFLRGKDVALMLAVNYIHHEIFPYDVCYHKMEKLLAGLTKEIEQQLADIE